MASQRVARNGVETARHDMDGAARDDVTSVLDHWRVDTVVWSTAQALPQQLLALGGWRQTYRDSSWALLVRDDAVRPA